MRLLAIDEVEARVEKLVAGGDGLVRFEGIPIFVPRAAPGDLLKVRITQRRPSFGRGEIIEVLEPGEGRREPPCPHYEKCGGCNLQHLEDKLQLRLKAEAVRENLLRLGGIEMPSDVTVIPGAAWGYRGRTRLHIAETDRGLETGYFARGTHDLVPVDSCPILVPELEEQLPLRFQLDETDHRHLDLAAGDDRSWTCQPRFDGLPGDVVSTTLDGITYQYDAGCFFQTHRQLLPRLLERALAPLAARTDSTSEESADHDSESVAYDLYAGVGLFSLPLCRRFDRVVAVEGDRVATRFARKNARLNEIANLEVENQAIETWIENLPEGVDLVIADPPRVGLAPAVRSTLVERRPKRLTYVSCDSATLARDLKELKVGFTIDSLTLLDMFPQTGHMEVVVQLQAREKSTTASSDESSEEETNAAPNDVETDGVVASTDSPEDAE